MYVTDSGSPYHLSAVHIGYVYTERDSGRRTWRKAKMDVRNGRDEKRTFMEGNESKRFLLIEDDRSHGEMDAYRLNYIYIYICEKKHQQRLYNPID